MSKGIYKRSYLCKVPLILLGKDYINQYKRYLKLTIYSKNEQQQTN